MPQPLTILICHFGDQWLRGSERVLLDLLANFDPIMIRPVVWTNVVPLAEELDRRGIATHRSDFQVYFDYNAQNFHLAHYRGVIRTGLELVGRFGVDVLHANNAAPSQWLVPVAWRSGLPLLIHLHTPYLRRSRVVTLLHQADYYVGVAGATLDGLRADGVSEAKLSVIPNGIEFSRFSGNPEAVDRERFGVPETAFLLAGVGSLIKRKGWDIALHALAKLDATAHLCIAGDGPDHGLLLALAASLGIENRVHLLGNIDNPAALYRAADVLVMPSRMEAFGLVAIEAAYFSLPVVATAVGGVGEVVQDGATGLLVPTEDLEALARAILSLKNDLMLKCSLGNAAHARALSEFSARIMAEKFERAYAALHRSKPRLIRRIAGAPLPYVRLARNYCRT
jgi:glycosyltransferase involved in cell wall biosynthesis